MSSDRHRSTWGQAQSFQQCQPVSPPSTLPCRIRVTLTHPYEFRSLCTWGQALYHRAQIDMGPGSKFLNIRRCSRGGIPVMFLLDLFRMQKNSRESRTPGPGHATDLRLICHSPVRSRSTGLLVALMIGLFSTSPTPCWSQSPSFAAGLDYGQITDTQSSVRTDHGHKV